MFPASFQIHAERTDRRNGIERAIQGVVSHPVAWYREFLPCEALQADVYVLFSFVPGATAPSPHRPPLREIAFGDAPLCAPQFGDGHVSFTFELGQLCDVDGRWRVDSRARRGTVVGPLSAVGRTEPGDLPATVGAFFRPARVAPFVGVPISDLTDRAIAIDDVWGTAGARLPSDLCELDEAARIDCFESILLARLGRRRHSAGALDMAGVAASILEHQGRVTVDAMARAAGVSRQHLAREFRERIGIAPKLYSRLARFQSLLVYANARTRVDWARAALEVGYADQSHMIAEFREFSGLTPQTLASRPWFHPFIERAKSSRWTTRLTSRLQRSLSSVSP
jgi:AraC-like DNA-binding protein